MPAKVNVLIEFLAELYGPEPYWDKDLDLAKSQPRSAPKPIAAPVGKAREPGGRRQLSCAHASLHIRPTRRAPMLSSLDRRRRIC